MKWLYFQKDDDVYRWPDNGKQLIEQEPSDVARYEADGTWVGPRKALLWSETLSGWFSESTDQVSEDEALQIMARVTARAKEKGTI